MKMHIIINLHKDFFNYYLYKLLFFLRSKPINHFFLFNIILFLPSKIEYICIFFFFPGFLFMNKNVLYNIKITASRLEGYVFFTHYEKKTPGQRSNKVTRIVSVYFTRKGLFLETIGPFTLELI